MKEQGNKEMQRDQGTKGLMDQGTKGPRDQRTKAPRHQGTKGQYAEENIKYFSPVPIGQYVSNFNCMFHQ